MSLVLSGGARWTITLDRTLIKAVAFRGRETLWAGSAAYEAPNCLPDLIGGLLTEGEGAPKGRKATLVLLGGVVQARRLDNLPPVRRPALRALVVYQSNRFFRMNGHPLVTDARWVAARSAADRHALAVAVDEELVLSALRGCSAAGLEVVAVHPAGERSLDLLPPMTRAARLRRSRRLTGRLAVAVGAIWLIVGLISGLKFQRDRRFVDSELRRLDTPLTALREARRRMDETSREVEAIDATAAQRLEVARLVLRIAESLPDSVVLSSLALGIGGAGSLTGTATSSLEVVAQLEKSGAVTVPRLEGSAIPEVQRGKRWERFTLVFGMKEQR